MISLHKHSVIITKFRHMYNNIHTYVKIDSLENLPPPHKCKTNMYMKHAFVYNSNDRVIGLFKRFGMK